MNFDRLEVLSHFLRSAYPDLDQVQGQATLTMAFDTSVFHSGSVSLEIHPCRWSGVSLTPSPIPYCGSAPEKPFLNASVSFGANLQHPLISYNASGSFISGKLQALRDEYKDKAYSDLDLRDKQRYWTETDALESLRSNGAKYGPGTKKEFVASLPIEAIQESTGCKLHPETAEFVVRLYGPPDLQWTVRGTETATRTQNEQECWAIFEPFEGRLTAMGL